MNNNTLIADVSAATAPVLPASAWRDAMEAIGKALQHQRNHPVFAGAVWGSPRGRGRWLPFVLNLEDPALPAAVTLGRHENCVVQLPAGSLRQVCVLGWADGAAWALDLNTLSPLEHVGTRVRRLESDHGALWFGAGGASIALVVMRPGQDVTAVPVPTTASHVGYGPLAMPSLGGEDGVEGCRPSEKTVISYLGRLRDRDSVTGGWADSAMAIPAPDGTYRGLDGRMVHPGRWAEANLAKEDLCAGVLMGRYERCATSALAQSWDGTSRVHALLFRRGDRNFVVDLASTNGTRVACGNARHELEWPGSVASWDNGDRMQLGGLVEFTLQCVDGPGTGPSGQGRGPRHGGNGDGNGITRFRLDAPAHQTALPQPAARGRCVGCGERAIYADTVCAACSG